MRNNYTRTSTYPAPAIFACLLILGIALLTPLVKAQAFYRTVSSSQLNITAVPIVEPVYEIKSEGTYLIKDGMLDEIYNLRLTWPAIKFDSLVSDKKITFEQTRVMVLPIMSMVHIIGTLDVDGIKSTTNFQLGFHINSDQSITFKGVKLFKLNDLAKDLSSNELKLAIDFVLKNNKNNLAVITAK
ncbi:hypothetical protein WG904_18370 [Pedobacter sp. Du54]|uniref:hypothetical protein n=1 Tax=Pedobacter anseongensis TaxID=3133439 RepID=UPI00309E5C29